MNKIQIIKFFSGIFIVVALVTMYTFIKVNFFDCKYGQCFVKQCIDMSKHCDQDNYDCCIYDTREVPIRDYLIKQIIFYGVISGCGLGIFVGAIWAGRPKKKEPYENKDYEKFKH